MEGAKSPKLFSLKEVEDHNGSGSDKKSVWIVIHDKVYDISTFLDEVRLWGLN